MNIQLNMPNTWNKLSPNVLKKVAWYFHTNKKGKELSTLLLFALLDLRWWQFKKILKTILLLSNVPLYTIKNHFNFLFTTHNLTHFIPFIKVNKTILFAPGDRLHNITAEQFALCEDFYFNFVQTNDLDYIKYITAILYLPAKQPFVFNEFESNAKKLSKIDKKTLAAIALSYKGSSLEIQSSYPLIFKRSTTQTPVKKATPKAPGITKIIKQLAGGKFGNLEQTKQTNVHDFLFEFNEQLKPKK